MYPAYAEIQINAAESSSRSPAPTPRVNATGGTPPYSISFPSVSNMISPIHKTYAMIAGTKNFLRFLLSFSINAV